MCLDNLEIGRNKWVELEVEDFVNNTSFNFELKIEEVAHYLPKFGVTFACAYPGELPRARGRT